MFNFFKFFKIMCRVTDEASIRRLAFTTVSNMFKDADGKPIALPTQDIFPILRQLSDSRDHNTDKSLGIFNRFIYVLTEYPDLLGMNNLKEMSAEDCCEILERILLNFMTFTRYIQIYQQFPKLLGVGKDVPPVLDTALTKMQNDVKAMAESLLKEINGLKDFISTVNP